MLVRKLTNNSSAQYYLVSQLRYQLYFLKLTGMQISHFSTKSEGTLPPGPALTFYRLWGLFAFPIFSDVDANSPVIQVWSLWSVKILPTET
jgi:hypothetical protein